MWQNLKTAESGCLEPFWLTFVSKSVETAAKICLSTVSVVVVASLFSLHKKSIITRHILLFGFNFLPASFPIPFLCSSKIHEDDLRRGIQTNVMVAPEVMAVFANSQIFQEHSPPKSVSKSPPSVKFAISPDSPSIEATSVPSSLDTSKQEDDSDKLLKRLEGNDCH